jgi:hypothetical protein
VNRSRVEHGLSITLATDAACVSAILVIAATARHSAPSVSPDPHAVALAYGVVAVAGLFLAAVAILPLRTIRESSVMSDPSRGGWLVATGLFLNSVGCVILLLGTGGVELPTGLFLLVGGDLLSVVYLVLFHALRRENPPG